MKVGMKALLLAAGVIFAGQSAAQITLFKDDGFQGNRVTADRSIDNFANSGFNDEASSANVHGGSWQVCSDAYFEGRCVVLRPGNYPSLSSMGMNDRISSVRPMDQYGRADERHHERHDRYADRPYDNRYDDNYGWRDQYYYGPRDRQ